MDGAFASFGHYRLIPAERLLQRDGRPVVLGSRALDLLIALVERAGEVLSQRELMARAWPNLTVEEANLRVTIVGLRKALGEGRDGARYIANVPGRGYCFVAPVARTQDRPGPAAAPAPRPCKAATLPPALGRMVGREDTVAALRSLLFERRFVSIIGPGGIGKSTVAVSVAHALLEAFDGAVVFVDLAALTDPALVPATLASALGVATRAQDPTSDLLAHLRDRRTLVVLDSCEHVIEAVADLAERLHAGAAQTHLLATSREALRAEGETLHLLQPLVMPADTAELTAAQALASPAVQLFMQCALASGHGAELTDQDAPLAAEICRRLDGIALAIELAGSRVGAYGLQGTANLLSNRFRLLWQGRRSALPRHQTLQAMLDWSYNLLSERDRRVLDGLSVFVGTFTLDAAQAVAADAALDAEEVALAIASLVDKSLVAVLGREGATRYRLLDTTRSFARAKLERSGEADLVARRHALFHAEVAQRAAHDAEDVATDMGDIRAALEWSFSPAGDAALGARLAAGRAPLLLRLSLLHECHRWCEQGLASLAESDRGSPAELALQEALAVSAMLTRGNGPEVRDAIERGLALAQGLGDMERQFNLLAGLHIFMTRIGDVGGAVSVARHGLVAAREIGSADAVVVAEWMLGCAYHLAGDQVGALRHSEVGFRQAAGARPGAFDVFHCDYRIRALLVLARTLWLRGFPERAARIEQQAMAEAEIRRHPVDLSIAMIYTTTLLLWRRDLDEAAARIGRLLAHAARHGLLPYRAVGQALEGELAVARGDPATGVELLRGAIGALQAERHHVLSTSFHRALAEGLMRCGGMEEAAETIGAALSRAQDRGESFELPELLRLRGEIWLRSAQPDAEAAGQAFQEALRVAQHQSALALELRAAISLARFWVGSGR
ncbi:MAG TPA: winged helix-turn-helix domain-containing protein, partial [Crenalkalicoccus sp.]|nr:winged helix-turn-helix domain-containing protein [Crenalkalicoccus sp.]